MMRSHPTPAQFFEVVISALNGYIRNNNHKILKNESNRQNNIRFIAEAIYKYFGVPEAKIDEILTIQTTGFNTTGQLSKIKDVATDQVTDEQINPSKFITTVAKISNYVHAISTGARNRSSLRKKTIEALQGSDVIYDYYVSNKIADRIAPYLPSKQLHLLSLASHWQQERISKADNLWQNHIKKDFAVSPVVFKNENEIPRQTFFRLQNTNKIIKYITLSTKPDDIDEDFYKVAIKSLSTCLGGSFFIQRETRASINNFDVHIANDKLDTAKLIKANYKMPQLCVGVKLILQKDKSGKFAPLPQKVEKIEVWTSNAPDQLIAAIPVEYDDKNKVIQRQPTIANTPKH